MLLRRLILILIAASSLTACVGDTPFLSREEAERLVHDININRDPFQKARHVAAIINNDIYYFNRLDTVPRKLTNSPASAKTSVKLSSDLTRIAYINADGNPVILDASDGKVLETLTQYNYIDQMGWIRNSATLYMLIDRNVVQYGTTLPITQPESFHPWDEVMSFSMNSKGDQGYFIDRYDDFSSTAKLEYHSTSRQLDEEYTAFGGRTYNYVDFYDDDGNFLLGNTEYYSGTIERVVCVEDYQFLSTYEWDYELMRSPKFNSESEILLYGTVEDQGTNDGKYYIKAVYLGTEAYPGSGAYDRLTKLVSGYASNTPVYIDWAQ